jgi:WD40 repeat protein
MNNDDRTTGSFRLLLCELPIEQALQVEEVCDSFEAKWREGVRPDVRAALMGLPEQLRWAALSELIQLDVYYRREAGELPTQADYAGRFPELDLDWLANAVADIDPNAQTATGAASSTVALPPVLAGEQFGNYELLGEIARGAMGIVYRARQTALDRVVALKMVRSGEFAGPDEVRRFRGEAEAAATLDHPNIVSIFEVGEHRGIQFYAMRLVEGGSLATRLAEYAVTKATTRAEAKLRQRAAATLIATVARAVNHAHQRRILHRDLKPGNILIDTAGVPHVTDFGLARRIGKDSTLTRTGAILGTPSYMAPEQARGREDVTTEADVYGLGAVLYELLAGRPPFMGEDVLDTLYHVREREPASPRSYSPLVDRDLETICLKCLEKTPDRRYSSAAALAEDLDRWSNGEPILARRASAFERAVKWTQRNPAGAGLVALGVVAATAIIWGLVALWYNARLEVANGNLKIERDEADRLRKLAEDQQAIANTQRGIADEQRKRAAEQEALARRYLYVTQMNQAKRAYEEKKFGYALALLEKLRPERADQEDLRGPEWHHLWRLCGGSHHDLRGHTAGVTSATYTADGLLLASGDAEGNIKLWDVEGQQEQRTFSDGSAAVNALEFDPTGKRLAAAGEDGIVRIWDVEAGRVIARGVGNKVPMLSLAFHPTKPQVASGGVDGSVRLWAANTGALLAALSSSEPVRSVRFTPDGSGLFAVSGAALYQWKRSPETWDGPTAVFTEKLQARDVTCTYIDPACRTVLIGQFGEKGLAQPPEGVFLVRSLTPSGVRREQTSQQDAVVHACVSADGSQYALLTAGGHLHLHTLPNGMRNKSLQVVGTVNAMCFDPRGRTLLTAGEDRTIRIHLIRDEVALPAGAGVGFGGTGSSAVVAVAERALDARTGTLLSEFLHPTKVYRRIAVSHDGRFVADSGRLMDLQNQPSGELLLSPNDAVILSAIQNDPVIFSRILNDPYNTAFSPDGSLVGIVGRSGWGVLRIPRAYPEKPPAHPAFLAIPDRQRGDGMWSTAVAFSPDMRTVAVGFGNTSSGGKSAQVELWDLTSGALVRVFNRHRFSVWGLAFSPDGKYLAGACGSYGEKTRSGHVKIWEVATGREVATLGGYTTCLWAVSFSPDGTRLATASGHWDGSSPLRQGQGREVAEREGAVRIWDVATGQEIVSFAEPGTVYGVAYSPDGKRLAVAGSGGVGRVWGPP